MLLTKISDLLSAPEVNGLGCFLNNFWLEQDRDLRFSEFDSQDPTAYFHKQIFFEKNIWRSVFQKISGKPRWISENCYRSLLFFLHIRNQHQKLRRIMYLLSLLTNFFFVDKFTPNPPQGLAENEFLRNAVFVVW